MEANASVCDCLSPAVDIGSLRTPRAALRYVQGYEARTQLVGVSRASLAGHELSR
jgi:hypothetical protein